MIFNRVKRYLSTYRTFFKGEVHLINGGFFRAKFSVKNSNCIIKVKNSTHIKCVDKAKEMKNNGFLPKDFEILAPMKAVKIISGELPDECLVTMHDSEYFKERLRWWGH